MQGNKKSELPRFECFHNGIILIVICFHNKDIIYFNIQNKGNRKEVKINAFKFGYSINISDLLGLKKLNRILLAIKIIAHEENIRT